jgi:hypothetical protein
MASSTYNVGWINNLENDVLWTNNFNNDVIWTSSVPSNDPPLWQQTLLSQYVASPTLTALIQSFSDAISPSVDIANFYRNIWSVATAVGNGLDIWGQIVGVSRYLQIPSSTYLGYEEAFRTASSSTGAQPFNQAPLYNGTTATSTFALSDAQYRRLIMVKAAANISNLSIPQINSLLRAEFGTPNGSDPYGQAYVQDLGGMAFNYNLNFHPSAMQIAIINNSGVFPRPAGVKVTLTYI